MFRFVASYALLSILYSLLSLGQFPSHPPWVPDVSGDLVWHLIVHVVSGLIAAAPSRRLNLILAGGIAVLALDADHLGYAIGLPMVGRPSHSLAFLVLVGVGMWALARSGFLGRETTPLVAGAVAAASVMAHVAWDVMDAGSSVPLWAPFTFTGLVFPPTMGIVFLSAATMLVWVLSFLERWRHPKALGAATNPGKADSSRP